MTEGAATAPEFLTVKELAALLRLKERKVYDLAASGKVPCTRATGKLLFPAAEVQAWIAGASGGGTPKPAARPAVFLGSHDPLLEWALRQSRCGLAMFLDGSLDGLERFAAREGVAAGLHLQGEDRRWNVPAVQARFAGQDVVLISWAARRRGLVLRPEDAGAIAGLADLAGRRLAVRQPESGTELLFGQLLSQAGLSRADIRQTEPARSETDAVLAVAQGQAEATFGLEAAARPFGLHVVPLVEERFDLLVDRRAYFEPPMQALLDFARTPAFAEHAAALGGYDVAGLGRVLWNG
jgi:excisionase family DNA binding protein